jgi:hypothetical protein
MESQQKISSVLLASNIGTLKSSQNKIKFLFLNSVPTSILVVIKKQFVWNLFDLHTADR